MFKRFDGSTRIARLLESVSARLARQRGLPMVIGIVLIIIAFAIQLLNTFAPSQGLALAWACFLHIGILIALIGIILVEPLGR
jgi:hypothetical protein